MKKFLIILLLSIVTCLAAVPVEEAVAIECGQNWYLERMGNLEDATGVTAIQEANTTVLYAINLETGFVLLAADDLAIPVFGYSSAGLYDPDNLPPQLEELLNWQKQEIWAGINAGETADAETVALWDHLRADEFVAYRDLRDVTPLLSTTWNQGQYYNALCPADNDGPGGHVWAGCVATAMAQVMKYWGYPQTGAGSHSYYDDSYGLQSANFGATTYNLDSMPNNVSSPNTAVATLFYHLGVSVDMDYSVEGSGAYSGDALDALVDYFQYDSGAQLLWRNNYPTTTWDTMLRTELDNGRPLYYRGQNATSGHAFNIDGYQGTSYFHLNWGWSGSYNGYFYLSDMTPGSHNYNSEQAAIFYLEPGLQPEITVTSPDGGESFAQGETVSITWDSQDISNNVGIMLYDGTSLELVISSMTSNDGSFNWTVPENQAAGSNYRVKVMDYVNNNIYDYSDSYFSIYDPIPEELENVVITVSDSEVNAGDEFSINVTTSELLSDWGLISYQFTLQYDASIMSFTSYSMGDFMGNILAYESIPGEITVAYANAMSISGAGNLVNLEFMADAVGSAALNITNFRYNTYDIVNIIPGAVAILEYDPFAEVTITVGSANTAIGGVVQIPLSTTELTAGLGAVSFQFNLAFDNSLLTFDGFNLGEVPNQGNLIANESSPGVISVAYANTQPITGAGNLCYLSFAADAAGTSDLLLSQFKYNSTYLSNLVDGSIMVSAVQYPDWTINAPDYEYSGTVWSIVLLDDVEVDITSGMLGCFVGDECRGVASLSDGSIIDYNDIFGHIIFLPMMYSNVTSGETMDFLYFDVETEGVYQVAESIDFVADMVLANGYEPFVFHASTVSTIDISKAMVPGWNWFSLNVTGEDMTTNSVLASIGANASNIKSQTQSAMYYPGPGWLGSLNTINNNTFYKLGVNNSATLEYTGVPVEISEITYDLTSGWNWISYAPQAPENINYALGSLDEGSNIKSQTQSAMYYAGPGWLGSLTTLQSLSGYMLKMNAPEQLVYPEPLVVASQTSENIPVNDLVNSNITRGIPDWTINPPDFEFSLSMWGIVILDGIEVDVTTGMLGCFVDGECRGIARADNNSVQYMEYFDHVLFLPEVYSNETSGEIITFLYYNAETDEVYEVAETAEFVVDVTIGDGYDPFVFTANTNSSGEDEIAKTQITSCYPNPFNPEVTISFYLQTAGIANLSIYNLRGQRVVTLYNGILAEGNHSYIWDGRDDKGIEQANGVYFYRLQSAGEYHSGKMLMLK
ncbi:MAG: C10 family peptidase [Candidatus Cloacimonetes bacterium]|nr:C10 family peptidase [Candidatus Cloacimonadota bacterium]